MSSTSVSRGFLTHHKYTYKMYATENEMEEPLDGADEV